MARGKGGRVTIATLNAPGIHVLRRDTRGREYDEGWGDGWDLVTKPSVKLRTIKDMMKQNGHALTVLTETRLRPEEMDAVRGHLRRSGYDHTGTPGKIDERSGHARCGIGVS